MISFLSSWVKGLGLAIIVISILEMILPNNKNKKYIRMVMGIYITFTMISPFIANKDVLSLDNINLETYSASNMDTQINQVSMDKRIEDIYIKELKKDITEKLKEKGYKINSCSVKVIIGNKEKKQETKISEIKVNVNKKIEVKSTDTSVEEKVVEGIQKIKPVEVGSKKKNEDKKIAIADIQNIKKFLIEEYGVDEKCLKIS